MSQSIQLENLNLSELDILLGHLRLGETHLKNQLSREQFLNLLKLGALNIEQNLNVSSNRAEKSGNVALVLNTIITSVFGAWMGFSGFMGLKLNSYSMLFTITFIALIISLMVGYFSFKLTALNAQAAIHKQKIFNLQYNVLKLIINRQEEKLESLVKYLNYALRYVIDKSFPINANTILPTEITYQFDTAEDFSQWMNELSHAIKIKAETIEEEPIYKFYSDRLIKIVSKLEEEIKQSFLINEELSLRGKDRSKLYPAMPENKPFLQILSKPQDYTNVAPPHKTWFRKNILSLIAGSIPTLLGGFASMFVFLAGGPNLAKELGLLQLEQTLRNPSSRVIEFSIALALTLYYGISFVYNNYKNYIRQHEIEKTQRQLSIDEKKDVYLKRKLVILGKIKRRTMRIINIYTAIENIDEFKHGQKNLPVNKKTALAT